VLRFVTKAFEKMVQASTVLDSKTLVIAISTSFCGVACGGSPSDETFTELPLGIIPYFVGFIEDGVGTLRIVRSGGVERSIGVVRSIEVVRSTIGIGSTFTGCPERPSPFVGFIGATGVEIERI